MKKTFWIPTLQLLVSGLLISGITGGAGLVWAEIKFHQQVTEGMEKTNARLANIERQIGIKTIAEK